MKYGWILSMVSLATLTACTGGSSPSVKGDSDHTDRRFMTYANPVDLPYRYQSSSPAYREAADPTVMTFRGRYWMFASHSKGYWYSTDLLHWGFVEATGYQVDRYAP